MASSERQVVVVGKQLLGEGLGLRCVSCLHDWGPSFSESISMRL